MPPRRFSNPNVWRLRVGWLRRLKFGLFSRDEHPETSINEHPDTPAERSPSVFRRVDNRPRVQLTPSAAMNQPEHVFPSGRPPISAKSAKCVSICVSKWASPNFCKMCFNLQNLPISALVPSVGVSCPPSTCRGFVRSFTRRDRVLSPD